MTMTIEIPQKVLDEATKLGVPVESLVFRALEEMCEGPIPEGFRRIGTPKMSLKEAAAGIREFQSRHTLGPDLTIRELLEDPRRY